MKQLKNFLFIAISLSVCVLAGAFTANAFGLPQYALAFEAAFSVAAFIPKSADYVAYVAGPDLSALTASLGKFGGDVLRKNVNTMDLDGVKIYRNVKEPIPMPKLSAVGGPRPYTEGDNIGQGAAVTDRVLTVYQSKWDFDIDPEKYRNEYLADIAFNGPFHEYILDQVAKEYAAAINDSTLGSGVYNAAGTGAADIADGFITILKAEVTALNLTAKTIGAITGSDAVTKVETFAELAPVWMQKMGFYLRCSYQTFHDYKRHYRTLNGFGFERGQNGQYILDGFEKPVILKPTSWITTDGLLAHVPGALVFGTDGERIKNAPSVRRNIIENRLMMPAGCQVADLDAVMVSDTLVA